MLHILLSVSCVNGDGILTLIKSFSSLDLFSSLSPINLLALYASFILSANLMMVELRL